MKFFDLHSKYSRKRLRQMTCVNDLVGVDVLQDSWAN